MMDEKKWLEDYRKQLEIEDKKKIEEHAEEIESFNAHFQALGFDPAEIKFEYIQTIGIVAKYPKIVSCLEPRVIPDKEGLVGCDTLYSLYDKHDMNPGYLYSDNHMIMLNPVFRREFYQGNNWSPRFVELFWGVSDVNIDSYISLDMDRVRINVDNLCYFEDDTWFGAPFKEDIKNISDGNSKLRPPSDLDESFCSFFFAKAYSLNINWSTNDFIKSFQALEFKNDTVKVDIDGADYFPARYIHAEYDLEQDCFRHFDGAVQYFTEDDYYARRDTDFRHDLKEDRHIKPMSEKAFKFNGEISTEMWKEFCSHFFSGNPLVYEYFSGAYPDHLLESIEKIRANQGK